jgi:Flp pilus assembly protein TadG
MKKTLICTARLRDQRGVTIILVAILMFVFLGIAALAIDLSSLYVTRNELQNAADAGALAGARFLYDEYGISVNEGANQIAYNVATSNNAISIAGVIPVDVNWSPGQNEDSNVDVQRGHWFFATRTFTANDSLAAVSLWGVTTAELDADPDFINAVRVVARRDATPVASFFARVFGHDSFQLSAEAVAYIGFAGTLEPGDVDAPIAICSQSLTGDTAAEDCEPGYDCNIGYMLSDGQDKNTAAWTNYSQPCHTANTTELRDLLTCEDSNPSQIELGSSMGATNGVVDAVINHPNGNSLVNCWKQAKYDSTGDGIKDAPIDTDNDGWPDLPWNLTLPVVNCPNLQVTNCMDTCGAVNVNIVWILEKENKIDDDAPYKMDNWNMESEPDGITRWNSFVTHFNLKNPNGMLATYENDGFKKKSIYFLPDCTPHELKGNTGGHNYGVLAKIPVLVK